MFDIPKNIVIEDRQFSITEGGDYRMVLDCFSMLNDLELEKQERIIGCLIIFYDDIIDIKDIFMMSDDLIEQLIKKMFWFFNCGQEESKRNSPRLINWDKDEQLVCSAVNRVAGKEIRSEEYLHWWTFMGYYLAVGESALSTVISIRYKIIHGEKLEKHERKFREENSQYFNWDNKTAQQHEAEDWVLQMWNKGGK